MKHLTGTIGTYQILNVFTHTDGSGTNADTSANVSIYYGSTATKLVDSGTFNVKDSVMGLYQYPFNFGTISPGFYDAVYTFVHAGTTHRGQELIFKTNKSPDDITGGVVPAKVGTITFENGTSGTHGFLKWTPETSIGYTVYRAVNPFSAFNPIGGVVGGTFTDGTVNNNTEYQYYVVGTNLSGASLPSNVVYGFVFGDGFNYSKNTYETLQTTLQTNVLSLKQVFVGKQKTWGGQLPVAMIIPTEETEEDFATTGQVDINYKANVRVYYSGIQGQKSITDLMEVLGKVKLHMEAVKGYQPYWFVSDIESVQYEEIDSELNLKYAEIVWNATRRVPRQN